MPFKVEKFLADYSIPSRKEGPNTHSGWIQVCCPICGDDNYHGGFNLPKGYYNCWKCGNHSLDYIIFKLLRCSFKEAKEIMKTYRDSSFNQKENLEKDFKKPTTFPFPKYFGTIKGAYKRYLENRNFDPKFLEKKYNLRASGPSGNYKFRIIAPIYYEHQIVSFQGRDITGNQSARYKACDKEKELIHHKNILYNLDNCRKDTIVVVEGFFDSLRIGDDCAATFGTEWTIKQFIILRNRFKRIFIIYDNEREAQNKAIKLSISLSAFKKEVKNFKLEGGDPADLKPEEALYLRKELNI